MNDDRVYTAAAKALVAAALIGLAIYGWLIVAGDTGLGGW